MMKMKKLNLARCTCQCFFTYIFTEAYTYVTYKINFYQRQKKGVGNNIVKQSVFSDKRYLKTPLDYK